MEAPLVVFVGELNPYGGPPEYALLDDPVGSSGERLRRLVCGLRRTTYLGPRVARHNLCRGEWSLADARRAVDRLTARYPYPVGAELHGGHTTENCVPIVLLGRRVQQAFRVSGLEAQFAAYGRYLLLPHPSGLSRRWNEPNAVAQARRLLREAVPGIPWGEADPPPAEPRSA